VGTEPGQKQIVGASSGAHTIEDRATAPALTVTIRVTEYLCRETRRASKRRSIPISSHRSTIVNVQRVKELRPLFRADYAAILRDGRRLTLSKAYRGRLRI
jgi:DNA-binding LytR/AlgR family response regulator